MNLLGHGVAGPGETESGMVRFGGTGLGLVRQGTVPSTKPSRKRGLPRMNLLWWGRVRRGKVGSGTVRFLPQSPLFNERASLNESTACFGKAWRGWTERGGLRYGWAWFLPRSSLSREGFLE